MKTFLTMGLSQCAAFDKENGAKFKLTGWGKISKDRTGKGISRSDKVKANSRQRESEKEKGKS